MTHATYRYAPISLPRATTPDSVSLVFTSNGNVRAVALREGQPLVVGRDEPSHVIIDDRSLSRTHARFSLAARQLRVDDLNSTNGTFVDDKQVSTGYLTADKSLRLGAVEVHVAGARAAQSPAAQQDDFAAILCHEWRRSLFFNERCSLVAVDHGGTLDEATLRGIIRSVDAMDLYTPQVALVLLVRAGEAEVQSFAEALRCSRPGAKIGAVVSPGPSTSPDELITLALTSARAARGSLVHIVRDPPSERVATERIVLAPNMLRVHDLVGRAARTTIPVLIVGETGTGKESIARSVHDRSGRAGAPFKAVNCAAMPTALISSTLFGHERGSFTGAERQAPGLFEQSDGGTLFLDEIGELSPEAQAALLRVLETKSFVRVGGTKELRVDVRLVAATHRDLAEMVEAGTFRADLLYRLDAFTLRIPPLRERVEEILPMAEYFLAASRARWGSSATSISPEARTALLTYGWPGNVRQLRNVLERASTVCSGSTIALDDLPDSLFERSAARGGSHPAAAANLDQKLRTLEIEVIRDALEKSRGNQSEAARLLGVPRRTLANRVHAYGLLPRKT